MALREVNGGQRRADGEDLKIVPRRKLMALAILVYRDVQISNYRHVGHDGRMYLGVEQFRDESR